jgi:SWIM zinc finger
VAERWDRVRVLALAPDAPSQRAAQSLASGRAWPLAGADESGALWGECRGSAATPYRAVVDLSGPAYRCSCPSRKFPCKHVLALLLLWTGGAVKDGEAEPPGWAASWLSARAERAGRAQAGEPGEPKDPRAAARRAEQREARVATGLAELDRWVCDQVRQGFAASQRAGYGHWDGIAARMIDAQAPGLAERLRALASVPHSGAGWDGRLLEEYALLRLLAVAYRRQGELPPPLRETVRARIGFSLRQADVLAGGQPVRDYWQVLARRDIEQDRIRARRTWLCGRKTGRPALVLSFAAAGLALDDSLTVGTDADADLVFYPGAVPLRAVVLARHGAAASGPPDGGTIAGLLAGYAAALAGDPWLDSWPAVLDITPARSPVPAVADADGDALPLHPGAGHCWPLFALSGGRPVTVAGEWTPRGLWPLTAWDEGGMAVPL